MIISLALCLMPLILNVSINFVQQKKRSNPLASAAPTALTTSIVKEIECPTNRISGTMENLETLQSITDKEPTMMQHWNIARAPPGGGTETGYNV